MVPQDVVREDPVVTTVQSAALCTEAVQPVISCPLGPHVPSTIELTSLGVNADVRQDRVSELHGEITRDNIQQFHGHGVQHFLASAVKGGSQIKKASKGTAANRVRQQLNNARIHLNAPFSADIMDSKYTMISTARVVDGQLEDQSSVPLSAQLHMEILALGAELSLEVLGYVPEVVLQGTALMTMRSITMLARGGLRNIDLGLAFTGT